MGLPLRPGEALFQLAVRGSPDLRPAALRSWSGRATFGQLPIASVADVKGDRMSASDLVATSAAASGWRAVSDRLIPIVVAPPSQEFEPRANPERFNTIRQGPMDDGAGLIAEFARFEKLRRVAVPAGGEASGRLAAARLEAAQPHRRLVLPPRARCRALPGRFPGGRWALRRAASRAIRPPDRLVSAAEEPASGPDGEGRFRGVLVPASGARRDVRPLGGGHGAGAPDGVAKGRGGGGAAASPGGRGRFRPGPQASSARIAAAMTATVRLIARP